MKEIKEEEENEGVEGGVDDKIWGLDEEEDKESE